jgi:hypothetical protein
MDTIEMGFLICLGFLGCLAALGMAGVFILLVAGAIDTVLAPSRERKHEKVMSEVKARLYEEGLRRFKCRYGLGR